MVKKHNLDRNQVLRYFNDYGDIEFRELVPENSDWIKNHEEKFQNFLANNQNREILEWYKECLKSVKFEKLSVKEQSLFFIESFLVFALTPDKSGNRRGAWKFLEKIFYLGRFYNIHLMPIKWIVDFQQTKSKKKTNLRIPEKMTTLAKKRYKSIQDGKNFFCFFTQEQINRAESGAVKGRKYIQLGSQKLPISEIQNPDSRAIDNLSPGSDFVSITIAEFHSILGALLKDKKPNTDEIVHTIARVLKKP